MVYYTKLSTSLVYMRYAIDVKNINLQIKNIKACFFHFYKKLQKNMQKNIKLQYPLK